MAPKRASSRPADGDGDPWRVSSSEEEEACAKQGAARRGRPPGLFGSVSLRRAMQSQRPPPPKATPAKRPLAANTTAGSLVPQEPGVWPATLGALMQPTVGGSPHKLIAQACRCTHVTLSAYHEQSLGHYLGNFPRANFSLNAEAAILGRLEKDVTEDPLVIASTHHFTNRTLVASICSFLHGGITAGRFRPIAMGTVSAHDETPMILRAGGWNVLRVFPELTSHGATGSQVIAPDGTKLQSPVAEDDGGQVGQTTKVLQSDHYVLFLFYDCSIGRRTALCVPLTAPLEITDSCTGEVVHAFLREQLTIPMFDKLRGLFPFTFDVGCADKGSANIKAEAIARAVQSARSGRLLLPCDVHIGYCAQGRQYEPIKMTISDLIGFAKAQQPGGAPEKLRAELERVLQHNVRVYRASPPQADHRWRRRLEAILDLFLEEDRLEQRASLLALLTGDIDALEVAWYTLDPEPDVQAWARRWLLC